jgi:hypothetical protein
MAAVVINIADVTSMRTKTKILRDLENKIQKVMMTR